MAIDSKTTVMLSSGFEIPVIGLGTSFSTTDLAPDPSEVENTVTTALKIGYRHIDCAPVYQNEAAIGRGIKASGVPRQELFITSKLWNTDHHPKDVGPAIERTLTDLGTGYVDLYLIHWPQSYVSISSTWKAMEELVNSGKAKSIGVSNFKQEELEELLSVANIPPAVNQIPATPYRPKKELVTWCQARDIHVTAWGPLTIDRSSQYNVAADALAVRISETLCITPAQLVLSWAVQRGTSVIPKSSNPERLQSNFEIVELSPEMMDEVDALELLQG